MFTFPVDASLGLGSTLNCRFADDSEDLEEFMTRALDAAIAEAEEREAVTTPPSFPALAGQGWSVHKRPTFSTRVASHVSGREVRQPLYAYTLYEFELTFDGLASGAAYPGLGNEFLQSLMGLYLQSEGQYGTFIYTDPTDNAATGQGIATGDGATTAFTFIRALGGFIEPVSWVSSVANVYLNGTVQTSGWSLVQPNTLTFHGGARERPGDHRRFLIRFSLPLSRRSDGFRGIHERALAGAKPEVPEREAVNVLCSTPIPVPSPQGGRERALSLAGKPSTLWGGWRAKRAGWGSK